MTALTNEMAARLETTMRANNNLLAEQVALMRLQVPQFYRVSELMARWALSREQVLAVIKEYKLAEVRAGRAETRVHIDQVKRMDRKYAGIGE